MMVLFVLWFLFFASPKIQVEGAEAGGQRASLRSGRKSSGRSNRKLGFLEDLSKWNVFGHLRNNWNKDWIRPAQGEERFDVVIVGAGMAGLAAAVELQNIDSATSYVILESTGSVGGRVRSTTFGASGSQYVVEDGANWIYDNNRYPTSELARDQGVENTFSDYTDFTMYDTTGTLVDSGTANARLNAFLSAFRDAEQDAENTFEQSEQPGYSDIGVVALLSNNGWSVASDSSGNMDYVFQWLYIDFEYAMADTSVRFFPYIADDPLMVHDQRGYQNVLQTFKNNNIGDDKIRFNTRVAAIEYDRTVCDGQVIACQCCGTEYNARVILADNTAILARRVISTVSVGVLNSGDIRFSPDLLYTNTPYTFAQYIKVFYQFSSKFWDSTQFVYTMRNVGSRGQCHHWQDMDSLIPGSGIIRCELMTEAFLALIDSSTQELSSTTLNSLLDPLRLAYGSSTVGTPIAIYYPKLNKDQDFGYGAYANWITGKSFTDFARYFGGIPNLVDLCDHNGCNSQGEWILHLAGAAVCYEHAEFVHGAYYSGQRSARFVMQSLGQEGLDPSDNECDVSFPELNTIAGAVFNASNPKPHRRGNYMRGGV